MGLDVMKKLKGEAKARQQRPGVVPASAPKFEPAHRFFVSSNWKNLLERRPKIAPKAAAAPRGPPPADGGAAADVVALDCEMVGVGPDGKRSALARVSIVNHEGHVLMDDFVRPAEAVTDYRTFITGITAATLKGPKVLREDAARRRAAELLDGKILVGHSLQNDFQVLMFSHPHNLIRDTALYKPLRPIGQKKTPSLAKLTEHWLHETIHSGSHDSVEDARMALRLYRLQSRAWEKQLRSAMKGSFGTAVAGNDDDADQGERVDDHGSIAASSSLASAKSSRKKKVSKKRQRHGGEASVGSVSVAARGDGETAQTTQVRKKRKKLR